MESFIGATPKSGALPGVWKKFKAYAEFLFNGPLKEKSEKEKCNHLMIWVKKKGRDVFNPWHITNEGKRKHLRHITRNFKHILNPKATKYSRDTNFSV